MASAAPVPRAGQMAPRRLFRIRRRAHAVLLIDRAGWHTTVVPKDITLVFLPSRAPELNPVENIWQYLRQNWLP
jgi:transposase